MVAGAHLHCPNKQLRGDWLVQLIDDIVWLICNSGDTVVRWASPRGGRGLEVGVAQRWAWPGGGCRPEVGVAWRWASP